MVPMSNEYRQELARSLTLRENILITLSTVTPASSVFIIIPSLIVGLAGGSVAAMVIAAFLAIFVGLCYAELSSRWPISGGEYTWAARLLGKPMGFGVLTLSLMAGILIISVIGSGVGTYLSVVWDGFDSPWTTIIVIVITTVVACFTIKTNAWVTGIFLGLEVLAVLVLVVLGFSDIQRGLDTFVTPQTLGASGGLEPVTWGVLFSLVSVALFAYGGYGTAVFYSEETKNASKTMARAVMVSLLVTVLVELLPVMAVILGADSLESLMASDTPMNDFLVQRGGETVNMLVSIGIAIAVFNAVIAIQIQNARLVFASARDRSWPVGVDRLLGSINPRTKSPIAATVLVGVL
ncbi:MAG: amino acid permease, partial [Actinobacteria bacterium]|nr:amino acid permease [Actinomycetota bacterium]